MSTIDCSICSETFGKTESSDEVVTPCGHIYHGHCLSDWLNRYLHNVVVNLILVIAEFSGSNLVGEFT